MQSYEKSSEKPNLFEFFRAEVNSPKVKSKKKKSYINLLLHKNHFFVQFLLHFLYLKTDNSDIIRVYPSARALLAHSEGLENTMSLFIVEAQPDFAAFLCRKVGANRAQ